MSFQKPVFVGDEVSCYCRTKSRGNTSLCVHVETWVRRSDREKEEKVTEGYFTFVAIDETGAPRTLP